MLMNALDKFGGDRELAAAVLGKTIKAVEIMISVTEELKAKHGKGPAGGPPTQADSLHRPNGHGNGDDPVRLDTSDRSLAISMIKEDKLLAEGLERLGLKPEEVTRAIGLRDFSKNQFVESVQIVGASMTTICVQLGTQVAKFIDRLAAVQKELENTNPVYRASLVQEEKFLAETLIDLSEQVRRMSDTAHRGMMLQAMIRYKLLGRKDPRKETAMKPGFQSEIPVEARVTRQPNHDQPDDQ
jgi:hypothetical protein